MSLRLSLTTFVAVLPLAAACTAEDPDELRRGTDLAAEQSAPVFAELIIDVVDQGAPQIADDLWVGDARGMLAQGECITHAEPGRCKVWWLRFPAEEGLLLHAGLCGDWHVEPVPFTPPHSDEPFTFSASVTLDTAGMSCAEASPDYCDDATFAEPALSITAVDQDRHPISVRGVMVESDRDEVLAADCMEVAREGCSEWASQRRSPGRYRATVDLCGETFASEWVDVLRDEAGCRAEPENVTLVVDGNACG